MNKVQIKSWETARAELQEVAPREQCEAFDQALAAGRKIAALQILLGFGVNLYAGQPANLAEVRLPPVRPELDKRLAECIPSGKFDIAAVENAAALGYPAINPILPVLLEWVQDANWPVAQDLFPLLAKAGPEIARHINAVFDGDDEGWKYSILYFLVRDLKPEVAEILRPNVIRMAQNPTDRERHEEIDTGARKVIAFWGWTDTRTND
jgi:Domain of unknown function (DUF5071)